MAQQEQYEDFANLRQAKVAKLLQKGRTPIVKRKTIAHWGIIKELKIGGMAFRPMSRYLLESHKLKVSSSYLATLWKELEAYNETPI